jgi:hypothetical protein
VRHGIQAAARERFQRAERNLAHQQREERKRRKAERREAWRWDELRDKFEPLYEQAQARYKASGAVLGSPWQRCTVHFLREALGHVRKDQQGMVAALFRPIFNADDEAQARELVGDAIARLERPLPRVAAMLECAEDDLLAFYAFPLDDWRKLRSTNPLERLNREIGRRTDVVGIFLRDLFFLAWSWWLRSELWVTRNLPVEPLRL